MKKILFGRTGDDIQKCLLFNSMAKVFEEEGYECHYLVFNLTEKKIYEDLNTKNLIYVPKNLSKDNIFTELDIDYEKVYEYTQKYNEANNYKYSKDKDFIKLNKFAKKIFELENKYKFNKFIIFNGGFMYDSLMKELANKMNIDTMMLEQGLFRPHTLTVDEQGVNFENSIPRDREFYESLNIDTLRLNQYLDKREDVNELIGIDSEGLRKNYYLYKIIDSLNNKLNKNKSLPYTNKPLVDKILTEINKMKFIKLPIEVFDSKNTNYIFIPFQVHDDSQILKYSEYVKNMDDLVRYINNASNYINHNNKEKIYFVFKEHPCDFGRIDYSYLYEKYKDNPYLIFLKKYDTNTLIENSKLAITVNSTVGIESLKKYKKVITLGSAFYSIDGMAYKYNFKSDETLGEFIIKILNKPVEEELINKFLYYLRFEYQVESLLEKGQISRKKLKSFINIIID